jgi:hypothetical protein
VAIEYDLNLVTEFNSKVALDLLAEKLGFEWYAQSHLLGTGLIVGALKCQGFSQSLFEEAYGFRPSICVWFRLDKFDDHDRGYRNMTRAIAVLLGQSDGDAVLVFNGEITKLQRIGGELAIDSKWDLSVLDEMTLPYQMRPLVSPLLSG